MLLRPNLRRSFGRDGSIVPNAASPGGAKVVMWTTELAGLDCTEAVVFLSASAEALLVHRGAAEVEAMGHSVR